ncbi:MAG: nucleotidyltransferase domain-containing protein [Vulcanimicrobiota bacterium]
MDFSRYQLILAEGPRPLFATVSGAHLYGFPSPDSDLDLRGAFVHRLPDILGLDPPKDSICVTRHFENIEVDWVAHDLLKFCQLMTRRNGYVLEQLYSPLVVYGSSWLEELRRIGQGCVIRPLYYHYRGFFHNQRKRLELEGATVKDLLYAYRVALTGVHVLDTGEIEAHLPSLLGRLPLKGIEELIERKVKGGEKGLLSTQDKGSHFHVMDKLEEALACAFEDSRLPMEPTTRRELSDFVVRARLSLGS